MTEQTVMKKAACALNATIAQDTNSLGCAAGSKSNGSSTNCSKSVASNGSKDEVAATTLTAGPAAVIKRNNNNQLQLRNFAGGEGRWSVEENSLIPDSDGCSSGYHQSSDSAAANNTHSQLNIESGNCYSSETGTNVLNGGHQIRSGINDCTSVQCNGFSNNNLAHNHNSLSNGFADSADSLYGMNVAENQFQFPNKTKINNNVCPNDKPTLVKDGMEEYFKQCSAEPVKFFPRDNGFASQYNIDKESVNSTAAVQSVAVGSSIEISTFREPKHLTTTTITTATITGGTTREVRSCDTDHLNLLNGDDYEDEDGCIYTYKEVSGFEDNIFDHLLSTCVSCGLPNLDPPKVDHNNEQNGDISPLADPINDQEVDNNLFSPEMDFLEMDFDPGSNVDDLESSDCDDNCYPDLKLLSKAGENVSYVINGSVTSHSRKHNSNNLSPERRTLMLCRRCETDSNIAGKLGNICEVAPTIPPFALNLSSNPNTCYNGLDDRPSCTTSKTGAISKNIDNKLDIDTVSHSNCSSNAPSVIRGLVLEDKQTNFINHKLECSVVCIQSKPNIESKENELDTKENGENNFADHFDDDEKGEEADDEREDNSPSEWSLDNSNVLSNIYSNQQHNYNIQRSDTVKQASLPTGHTMPPGSAPARGSSQAGCSVLNGNSLRVSSDIIIGQTLPKTIVIHSACKQKTNNTGGVSFVNVATSITGNSAVPIDSNNMNKDSRPEANKSSTSSTNNNLGSLSAPEVSPAHEYPQQDKFKRSVSFHNQLSSPKYDNICFLPHRNNLHEDNIPPLAATAVQYQNIDNVPLVNTYLRTHRHSHPCYEGEPWSCGPHRSWIGNAVSGANNDTKNIPDTITECGYRNNEPRVKDGRITNTIISSVERSRKLDHGADFRRRSSGSCNTGASNGGLLSEVGRAQVTACTLRLLSRENDVFNITPDAYAGMAAPSSQRSPSDGSSDSDKLSALVVKGSLPPKTSDPSLDVNTTPACSSGGGLEKACPRIQEKVMVWTERQATARQVLQLQRSSCGLSAVANVLLALEQHVLPSALSEQQHIIRQRAEGASLVDYLLSRSCAGTTHKQLIEAMTAATSGSVVAKFFPMFPKRAVQLSRWLAQWISRGGVCVCTLNLQCGVGAGEAVPDAWHHQMVFGVGPQGVYLTNPVECVCEEVISRQLCSERVLLVRRCDVIRHWHSTQALHGLLTQQDPRWRDMNVLGQVSLVLKEDMSACQRRGTQRGRQHMTSHVAVPAAYHSGITVFMRQDNPHRAGLLGAEDLPLLE